MAREKKQPCCVRAEARLGAEKANLQRLASRAARRPEQRRYVDMIAKAKASVEMQRQLLVEHEASHAGEVDTAAWLDGLAREPRAFA